MTTHHIPRPDWVFDFSEAEDTFTLKPVLDEMSRKRWEVEEEMLTTGVVDLLRSKGWTVIPPREESK